MRWYTENKEVIKVNNKIMLKKYLLAILNKLFKNFKNYIYLKSIVEVRFAF